MENLEKINKKSKVLIIGSSLEFSLEKCYLRAFKKLGYKNVNLLSFDNNILLKTFSKINFLNFIYYILCRLKLIYHIYNNNSYNLIIVFKGIQLKKKTLVYCKNKNKKTIWMNIYTDNPFNLSSKAVSNQNVLSCISFYDYFCTSFFKKIKKKLKNYNVKKYIYLPFGYDPSIHCLKKKKINKSLISFVGAYDLHRLNFLKKIKKNISIHGNGWNKSIIRDVRQHTFNKSIFGIELSHVVSKSLVSLNILRKQDRESHNMKTFEIPAMGGLMLTERSLEQNFFFPEGKACFMYKNYRDLIKKIEFIIANNEIASKIRKEGIKLSKKHTYSHRLRFLINKINENKHK